MPNLDAGDVERKLYLNQPLTAEESRALSSLMMMMSACTRASLGKSEPDSATGYRLLESDYRQHFADPGAPQALPEGA